VIITSREPGSFKELFRSSVHISLHYSKLDASSRKKIWLNFFEGLKTNAERIDYWSLANYAADAANHELNGWEIRNALDIARQLARQKDQTLSREHLERAIQLSGN
jgi:hypothetical protein